MDGSPYRWAIAAAIAGGAFAATEARAAEIIRPCQPGTPAHEAARAQLHVLDSSISELAPGADPTRYAKWIEELGAERCFRVIGGLSADAKSGLALRTWWESGGQAVAASALALASNEPIVWVAPDVRRALTRETAPRVAAVTTRSATSAAPSISPPERRTAWRAAAGWR